MGTRIPDIEDRERFIALLVLGEVLTKRGETGPLARVWRPAGRRRATPPDQKRPPEEKTP